MPQVTPPPQSLSIATVAIDGVNPSVRSATFQSGSSLDLAANLNDHAARIDGGIQALSGVFAIVSGFDLTFEGIRVDIAHGTCLMLGLLEFSGGSDVLADNATNWVWLSTNGTLWTGLKGTMPEPSGLFLGEVETKDGEVVRVSREDVFFMGGGLPYRALPDGFEPTDAPTCSGVHLVRTTGATWMWDGDSYLRLVEASKIRELTGKESTSDIVNYLKEIGLAK
jgi:hypothetical protein